MDEESPPQPPKGGVVNGVLNSENEVVSTENATVAQATGLSAGGELYEAGWIGTGTVDIDGEGDTLFTEDAVSVRGGDVPDAPRNPLCNFR